MMKFQLLNRQDIQSDDVQSYADLFKVFWTTMDQRYNYFYEQKKEAVWIGMLYTVNIIQSLPH